MMEKIMEDSDSVTGHSDNSRAFVRYRTIVDYMQENHLSRAEMAKALEVSPQYLSRILSGTENFSIKSVAKIEATGVSCLEPVYA